MEKKIKKQEAGIEHIESGDQQTEEAGKGGTGKGVGEV